MSAEKFSLINRQSIPSLNIIVNEYRHNTTGARHFHLAAEDENNAFLVAFLTVPTDSTGVAHILEHTTLCGSRRYPVRDPFFMMIRRSLNTFMNAFTASDWTAYPFATCNRKDFNNLLQVYLDATFFPNLNPLDFAQEGHRCWRPLESPWYTSKTQPSFADMLNTLRRLSVRQQVSTWALTGPGSRKIQQLLENAVTIAA